MTFAFATKRWRNSLYDTRILPAIEMHIYIDMHIYIFAYI